MKPRERFPPDDPREWLNRARSNLALAKNRVPDVYVEDLCFEAQQAAEKAIKAVMISRGIDFPYVHNPALLLLLLEESGESFPDAVRRAARLTPHAVDTRYPASNGSCPSTSIGKRSPSPKPWSGGRGDGCEAG